MIAADTSSLVSFFEGGGGEDVELIARTLNDRVLYLPPPVRTELLSDPKANVALERLLLELPSLDLLPGFWERAAAIRRKLLARKLKARLGDALIAQLCIDHDAKLITRDGDFRHYVKLTKLKLAVAL